MSITNPERLATKQDLSDMYQGILPYLNGSTQLSTMPTASADYLGTTVQYVGATGGGFTHNYFYECVSDGESTPTYSWSAVNVQAGSSIDTTIIAPEFDATESYSEGDRVTKDGKLYVFTADHTGAWDAEDVEETDIDSEMPTPMSASDLEDVVDAFNPTHTNAWNQVVIDERGTEYVVGKYVNSDGTEQPLYEKTVVTTSPTAKDTWQKIVDIGSTCDIQYANGYLTQQSGEKTFTYFYSGGSGFEIAVHQNGLGTVGALVQHDNWLNRPTKFIVRYIKTTDVAS